MRFFEAVNFVNAFETLSRGWVYEIPQVIETCRNNARVITANIISLIPK